jgi:hypothetical protein
MMGTGRVMKTIEASMVMLVPSDLSSTQLLQLPLQWADIIAKKSTCLNYHHPSGTWDVFQEAEGFHIGNIACSFVHWWNLLLQKMHDSCSR